MPLKSLGLFLDPIPVAERVFGGSATGDHDHTTTTVVTHIHDDADIPEDLELDTVQADSILVEDLHVTDELQVPVVDAEEVVANIVTSNEIDTTGIDTDVITTSGVDYRISKDYLPTDVNNVQAGESVTTDNTIVVRSRATGVRCDNLVVRGRESGYTGAAEPGLWTNLCNVSDRVNLWEDADIVVKNDDGSNSVITHFANPADAAGDWELRGDGKLSTYDTLETTVSSNTDRIDAVEEEIEDGMGDESRYIGSLKYSFKRSAREPKLRILKQNHIPIYLANLDPPYTNADLPAGKSRDDLTIAKWRKEARQFTNNPSLKFKDVFPSGNADWDFIDAHIPVAEGRLDGHDTSIGTLQTDVSTVTTKLGTITETEIGYLDGVTGNIQTQIDGAGASNPLVVESSAAGTDAEVEVRNSASGGKTKLTISNLTSHDTQFYFETFDNNARDELTFYGEQASGAKDCIFMVSKYGNICFVGANVAVPSEVGSIGARFLNSVKFEHANVQFSNLPTSAPGTSGRVWNDGGTLKIT